MFYEDKEDIKNIKKIFTKYSKVLILAPGSSLKTSMKKVIAAVDDNTFVVTVNFIPNNIIPNAVFLTNMKRYDVIKNRDNKSKLIITSNLLRDVEEYDYVIAYNEVVYFNDEYCDDSTLMLLNLLNKIGVTNIIFAGFDGRKNGKLNFIDNSFEKNRFGISSNSNIKNILENTFSNMNKQFITKSEYE